MYKVEFLGIDFKTSCFVKVPMNVNMAKIANINTDIMTAIKQVAKELVSMNILPVDVVSVYDTRSDKYMWQEEKGDYYTAKTV